MTRGTHCSRRGVPVCRVLVRLEYEEGRLRFLAAEEVRKRPFAAALHRAS